MEERVSAGGLSKITISPEEQTIFSLLLDSVTHGGKSGTVLRVAGGWVRDKLLGKVSSDIDIALNNQSGIEFAASVNRYLESLGQETRTIAVIQANPEQSKHLETANLRVLGHEIDCVNLRAETYTDSRIPEIRIGTPHEDALRRDFTINALFYNINTGEVEDFTGYGLADLQRGIIRTPITPHSTFIDDPLRVLRAIRFASRLNFRVHRDIRAAATSPDIHQALQLKVSRERVYKECEGCLNKHHIRPALVFALMRRLRILDAVLPVKDIYTAHSRPARTTTIKTTQKIAVAVTASMGATTAATAAAAAAAAGETAETATVASIRADAVDMGVDDNWQAIAIESVMWLNVLESLSQQGQLRDAQVVPLCNNGHNNNSSNGSSNNSNSSNDNYDNETNGNSRNDNQGMISAVASEKIVVTAAMQLAPKLNKDDGFLKVQCWAAVVASLRALRVLDKKNKEVSFISVLLREAVKMDNHTLKQVLTMTDCLDEFTHLAHLETPPPIGRAGAVLRVCKDMWRHAIILTCAIELAASTAVDFVDFFEPSSAAVDRAAVDTADSNYTGDTNITTAGMKRVLFAETIPNSSSSSSSKISNPGSSQSKVMASIYSDCDGAIFRDVSISDEEKVVIEKYLKLISHIESLGLDHVWLLKPLLNGKDLMSKLGLKMGPAVGRLMESQLQWQIQEQSNDADACVNYLKSLLNLPNP